MDAPFEEPVNRVGAGPTSLCELATPSKEVLPVSAEEALLNPTPDFNRPWCSEATDSFEAALQLINDTIVNKKPAQT